VSVEKRPSVSASDVIPQGDDLPIVVAHPEAAQVETTRPKGAGLLPSNQSPRLGNYQLVARFRSSEQAFVFLAYQASNLGISRPVVLKFAPKASREYASHREHLVDEYRAMMMLDHPNVVGVLDAAEIEQGFYVAIEYVEGLDAALLLSQLARQGQRMPFEVSCYVLVELLRGLEAAHGARGVDGQPLEIIHRDVNPANVLLSRLGRVKLTDFGVVKMRGRIGEETLPGFLKGKPTYLPPEYLRGEPIDHRADIYSAGVLFFELLTGTKCFQAGSRPTETFQAVLKGVQISRLFEAGVPEGLVWIVQRATGGEPDERFFTAAAFGGAIEDWLTENGKYVSATALASIVEHWMRAP
jgi:eukaryotic-like serine/threonine-protein kinase